MTDERQNESAEIPAPQTSGERTGVRQYVRQVQSELKRVHWPSRREVTQYSIVVLIAVSLLGAFIFGLDQLFGQFIFWIFG